MFYIYIQSQTFHTECPKSNNVLYKSNTICFLSPAYLKRIEKYVIFKKNLIMKLYNKNHLFNHSISADVYN